MYRFDHNTRKLTTDNDVVKDSWKRGHPESAVLGKCENGRRIYYLRYSQEEYAGLRRLCERLEGQEEL